MNPFGANRSTKVSKMLVVQRWRAMSSTFIRQMSKVEDGTPSLEEGFSQDRK